MSYKNSIGIIVSQFNREITDLLYTGALDHLKERGFEISPDHIYHVPGAVEIPVVARHMAERQLYDVILCLGAVIRGETSHYDYVCSQVSYGCQKVAITYGIPVIFGILTTEDEQQAFERCGGKHGHKGKDCADAALHMIDLMRRFK